jgi:hypothetical protein
MASYYSFLRSYWPNAAQKSNGKSPSDVCSGEIRPEVEDLRGPLPSEEAPRENDRLSDSDSIAGPEEEDPSHFDGCTGTRDDKPGDAAERTKTVDPIGTSSTCESGEHKAHSELTAESDGVSRREPQGVQGSEPSLFYHRILKRLKESKRKPLTYQPRITKKRLERWRGPITDPTLCSPLRQAGIDLTRTRRDKEYYFGMYSPKMDPGHSVNLALDRCLLREKEQVDVFYRLFAQSIGVTLHRSRTLVFDKKATDLALAGAIGSIGRPGDGVFEMYGIMDLDFSSEEDAGRAFSLYIARKCLGVVDPRKSSEATSKAITRLTNPAPPHPLRSSAVALIERMAKFLFPPEKVSRPPPNSGMACAEMTRGKGGKRVATWKGLPETDLFPMDFCRLETIYTGGKFRTIGVHSVRHQEFSWLNGYMFNKIRDMPWCIAGRDVSDWAAGADYDEGDICVSGDLSAATDYFAPEMATAVIGVLVSNGHISSSEGQDVLKGLTQAELHVNEEGKLVSVGKQERGQLMSSDLSFPILTMSSFVGAILALEPDFPWKDMSDEEFGFWLLSRRKLGVNGDDVIFFSAPHVHNPSIASAQWEFSVGSIGGVPEPTKSPMDREYFTVNSELWSTRGGLHKVDVIKPGKILSLLTERHKVPDIDWLYLQRSKLWTEDGRRDAQLDVLLLPEVPRSLGGLGMLPPWNASKDLLFKRLIWARESRGSLWTQAVNVELPLGECEGNTVSISGEIKNPRKTLQTITGLVPKDWYSALLAHRYGIKKGVYWSSSKSEKSGFYETRLGTLWHTNRDAGQRDKYLKESEALRYWEAQGYVYVRDLALTAGSNPPSILHHPKIFGVTRCEKFSEMSVLDRMSAIAAIDISEAVPIETPVEVIEKRARCEIQHVLSDIGQIKTAVKKSLWKSGVKTISTILNSPYVRKDSQSNVTILPPKEQFDGTPDLSGIQMGQIRIVEDTDFTELDVIQEIISRPARFD